MRRVLLGTVIMAIIIVVGLSIFFSKGGINIPTPPRQLENERVFPPSEDDSNALSNETKGVGQDSNDTAANSPSLYVEPEIYENLKKEDSPEGEFAYTFTIDGIKYATATVITVNNEAESVLATLSKPEDYYPWHSFDSSFTVGVTESGLDKLKNNSLVLEIKVADVTETSLGESVPLINASTMWSIVENGTNITGGNQTVCVVDSGVTSNNPYLYGKIAAEKCFCDTNPVPFFGGCCPNGGEQEDNATDGYGHGTNVVGIVTAYGNLTGVAPGSKVAVVRVTNNAGSGTEDDMASGINWCRNNKENYNITVITISMSAGGLFSGTCDNEVSSQAVNDAVNNNGLFVSVASGNNGERGQITDPACASKATSVGATYDKEGMLVTWQDPEPDCTDDPTNTSWVACGTNRNSMLDLLAPGANINSTYFLPTNYTEYYGTSQATPHVAGAAAILIQYWKLRNNRVLIPVEIEELLKGTGKLIYDGDTELNFSRIDVYSAIFPIDAHNFTKTNLSDNTTLFRFKIKNNNNSYQNISWGLDIGNGTWINSSGNIPVPPKKDLLVQVNHNYTSPGIYTPKIWASNSRLWNDTESMAFNHSGLLAHNLTLVWENSTTKAFKFTIINNMNITTPSINWSLVFGDGQAANLQKNLILQPWENMTAFATHTYSAGNYTAYANASNGTLRDNSDSVPVQAS